MEGKKIKQKKWIIVLAVLVAVAIAVTLVVVLLPKNTRNAVKQLEMHSHIMYLKKEESDNNFKELQSRINGVVAIKDEFGQEVTDVYSLCQGLNFSIEFYSSWLIYAQDNGVFQGEYNNILRQINISSSKQADMEFIVSDALSKFGPLDSGFYRGVWNDFKDIFVEYLQANSSLIKSLNKVYQACVPQGIMTNSLTYLTLNTIDDCLDVVNEKPFSSTAKISCFKNLLDYLNPSLKTVLLDFNFNDSLQTKHKLISSFSKVYTGKTIKDLIKSINTTNGFDFQKLESDDDNVLGLCQEYLLGRLSA